MKFQPNVPSRCEEKKREKVDCIVCYFKYQQLSLILGKAEFNHYEAM